MSVHYKFKSSLISDKVTFDGVHISVSDLKKAITHQKKIGKSADFDLQITNAQTKEVYDSDDAFIPKNTSVVVSRIPITKTKKSWEKSGDQASSNTNYPTHVNLDNIIKSSDLSNSNATEEDKIKVMMSQSTQDYDSSKFLKNKNALGPLPPNYTCYRCGLPGHYIKHCPTNNMDIKRSTGIPRSFMIPASADQKGALLTASGEYAVPIIDHEAYKEVKKEKPPFLLTEDEDSSFNNLQIPDELKCMLCKDLLNDAVLIPCCGNSYCDDCIRTYLLESDSHQCPTCLESGISPDTLIPNRFLRNSVLKFKNETGYSKLRNKERYSIVNVKNDSNKISKDELINKPNLLETPHSPSDQEKSSQENISEDNNTNEKIEENKADISLDEVILNKEEMENTEFTDDQPKESPPDDRDENENTHELSKEIIEEEPAIVSSTANERPDEKSNEATIVNSKNADSESSVTEVNMIQAVTPNVPQSGQYNKIPILPHPTRGMFHRSGILPDPRFYRPPLSDPLGYSMKPAPYGYSGISNVVRPTNYHDPFGFMGHPSHMQQSAHYSHLYMGSQIYSEPPPPGSSPHNIVSEGHYSHSTNLSLDYEDPLDRFAKQLRSRSRRSRRSRSRSRERSGSRSRSDRSRRRHRSVSPRDERKGSYKSRSRHSPRKRSRERTPERRKDSKSKLKDEGKKSKSPHNSAVVHSLVMKKDEKKRKERSSSKERGKSKEKSKRKSNDENVKKKHKTKDKKKDRKDKHKDKEPKKKSSKS